MRRAIVGAALCLLASSVEALPACTVPNSLTNGTTADASKVMGNFNSLAGCAAPAESPNLAAPIVVPLSPSGGAVLRLDRASVSASYSSQITFSSAGSANFAMGTSQGAAPSDAFSIYNYYAGANPITVIATTNYVGINTVSPSYNLHVNGSVAGTGAYNALSDRRLKKDIAPIKGALNIIDRIQGVRFKWRQPAERSIGAGINLPVRDAQVGFIAQDLRAVVPEAVTVADDADHTLSVAESKMVPLLVEAVKELKLANRNLEKIVQAQAKEIVKIKMDTAALRRNRMAKLN